MRLVALLALGGAGIVMLPFREPLRAQQANREAVGVAVGPSVTAGDRSSDWGTRRALKPADGRRGGLGLSEVELRRLAPLASLALPGLGQAVLHQDRFVAYLAAEAWSVLEYASQKQEWRRQRDGYRDLARNVARAPYGPPFPVGPWTTYYEKLEHFIESGVFDRTPGGDVDPEIDESTYNGSIWLLARTTFWADPAVTPPKDGVSYRTALNFYLDRAVRPEFRWSWRNAQLEQDQYITTIRRANSAYRSARAALGMIIANHLLSTVDAFITLRVEGLDGGGGRGLGLTARLPLP